MVRRTNKKYKIPVPVHTGVPWGPGPVGPFGPGGPVGPLGPGPKGSPGARAQLAPRGPGPRDPLGLGETVMGVYLNGGLANPAKTAKSHFSSFTKFALRNKSVKQIISFV